MVFRGLECCGLGCGCFVGGSLDMGLRRLSFMRKCVSGYRLWDWVVRFEEIELFLLYLGVLFVFGREGVGF